MTITKENYLKIHVGISTRAKWYLELREKMKRLNVKCYNQFHITAMFLKDDSLIEELKNAFDRFLFHRYAPHLTFNKIEAFTSNSGKEHIVGLTSTRQEVEFRNLIEGLRNEATNLGANLEDYRLHVTLARVPVNAISLQELEKIIANISLREFTVALTNIDYKYKTENSNIDAWKLETANKRFTKNSEMWNYKKINNEVMTDTKKQYESVEELKEAVKSSIERQYMVAQEDNIDQPKVENIQTQYVCSGKRSFEAAMAYKGKKTAVLNFANCHSIGGSPFYSGAQEESLCRCSTLLPCLEAMREPFYMKHKRQYDAREIGNIGTDDLIYTPDVVVFKTDERTDPIYPKMMDKSEWYKVDVITSAAPEMMNMNYTPKNYVEIITSRIKKILDVAAKEKVEVLILGAWGCGAFKNDDRVVSKAFFTLLENYNFEVVEFALSKGNDFSHSPFNKANHVS